MTSGTSIHTAIPILFGPSPSQGKSRRTRCYAGGAQASHETEAIFRGASGLLARLITALGGKQTLRFRLALKRVRTRPQFTPCFFVPRGFLGASAAVSKEHPAGGFVPRRSSEAISALAV